MSKKISWGKIQKYYDEGHSWADIILKFGLSKSTLYRASKNKIFKSRNHKDAIILYHKNNIKTHTQETKKKIGKSVSLSYSKKEENYITLLRIKVNRIIDLFYLI